MRRVHKNLVFTTEWDSLTRRISVQGKTSDLEFLGKQYTISHLDLTFYWGTLVLQLSVDNNRRINFKHWDSFVIVNGQWIPKIWQVLSELPIIIVSKVWFFSDDMSYINFWVKTTFHFIIWSSSWCNFLIHLFTR